MSDLDDRREAQREYAEREQLERDREDMRADNRAQFEEERITISLSRASAQRIIATLRQTACRLDLTDRAMATDMRREARIIEERLQGTGGGYV